MKHLLTLTLFLLATPVFAQSDAAEEVVDAVADTAQPAHGAEVYQSTGPVEAGNESDFYLESYGAEKWSEADRKAYNELREQQAALFEQQRILELRIGLYPIEAKERSGQKLTADEISTRDHLRLMLKGGE